MSLFQALVLAVVQGLTEFLPISSTAHLILVPWLFGWHDPGLAYDVALHAGTLVAVVAYFARDWPGMGGGLLLGGGPSAWRPPPRAAWRGRWRFSRAPPAPASPSPPASSAPCRGSRRRGSRS